MIPFTYKQIYGDKSQNSTQLWEEVVVISKRKGALGNALFLNLSIGCVSAHLMPQV